MSASYVYRPPSPVRVVAIKANWRVSGETVRIGATYSLDPTDAQSMIALDKAKLA